MLRFGLALFGRHLLLDALLFRSDLGRVIKPRFFQVCRPRSGKHLGQEFFFGRAICRQSLPNLARFFGDPIAWLRAYTLAVLVGSIRRNFLPFSRPGRLVCITHEWSPSRTCFASSKRSSIQQNQYCLDVKCPYTLFEGIYRVQGSGYNCLV